MPGSCSTNATPGTWNEERQIIKNDTKVIRFAKFLANFYQKLADLIISLYLCSQNDLPRQRDWFAVGDFHLPSDLSAIGALFGWQFFFRIEVLGIPLIDFRKNPFHECNLMANFAT